MQTTGRSTAPSPGCPDRYWRTVSARRGHHPAYQISLPARKRRLPMNRKCGSGRASPPAHPARYSSADFELSIVSRTRTSVMPIDNSCGMGSPCYCIFCSPATACCDRAMGVIPDSDMHLFGYRHRPRRQSRIAPRIKYFRMRQFRLCSGTAQANGNGTIENAISNAPAASVALGNAIAICPVRTGPRVARCGARRCACRAGHTRRAGRIGRSRVSYGAVRESRRRNLLLQQCLLLLAEPGETAGDPGITPIPGAIRPAVGAILHFDPVSQGSQPDHSFSGAARATPSAVVLPSHQDCRAHIRCAPVLRTFFNAN